MIEDFAGSCFEGILTQVSGDYAGSGFEGIWTQVSGDFAGSLFQQGRITGE